jgi:hypothetical protein
LAILLYSIAVFFLLVKRKLVIIVEELFTKEKMLFTLCISFVLLMPVSADYYLLIMFIPILAYPKTNYSLGYYLCYGLLLGAKNFEYIGIVSYNYVSWQVFINPILLLLLLFGELGLLPSIRRDSSELLFEESKTIKGMSYLLTRLSIFIRSISKKSWVILGILTAACVLAWAIINYRIEFQKKQHNIEAGLPEDFNAVMYLDLNPQLVEFWNSKGINESGPLLIKRAEDHYKAFGSKEGY